MLNHPSRGPFAGELRVDASFTTDRAVIIDTDTGLVFNIGRGTFGPRTEQISKYGSGFNSGRLPIPKLLRMQRFPDDAQAHVDPCKPPFFDAAPLVDVTIPVAQRIPQEVFEELRRDRGTLRLKLRIHPGALLVGWDIVRRPGDVPGRKDSLGRPIRVPPQYSSIGGDFCERQIWYEQLHGQMRRVERKGWYIDPVSKQRVETDY